MLSGRVYRQPSIHLWNEQSTLGFHVRMHLARSIIGLFHDMNTFMESILRTALAILCSVQHIPFRMKQNDILLQGLFRVRDHGKQLVIHFYKRQSIFSDLFTLSRNRSDGVTCISHSVYTKYRLMWECNTKAV
ncbi:hypothetical protein D3C81_1431470 [compost metagenome]